MPDLAGRRVLVTGATGFIGTHLVLALLAHGAEVHVLVRDAGDPRLPQGVRAHAADLCDPDAVARAVSAALPETVVHLAVARGECTALERAALWQVNAVGTVGLLEAAAECGCGRFVHVGSSFEYGLLGHPFRESDPPVPDTEFGASKVAATSAVGQYGASGRLDTVTLRVFSVYGPGEPAHRLAPTAIRAALSGDTLRLTAPGPVRDFVFIGDVCDALLHAATIDSLPQSGGVYNVGTGIETSNAALVDAVERATGRPIARSVGAFEPRATDRTSWCADTTLAREELGWEAATTLDEGLALHVAAIEAELGLCDG